MAKLDASPDGGLSIDQSFFPHGEQFRGLRVHQIRLKAATPPQTPTATADTRQLGPGCDSSPAARPNPVSRSRGSRPKAAITARSLLLIGAQGLCVAEPAT